MALHFQEKYQLSCVLLSTFCQICFRWWVGSWQQCTATCGSEGVRKRTVLCVRTVSWEERVLHPVECKHLLKPKPVVPCNRDVPCGKDWAVSSWGEVSPILRMLSFYLTDPLLNKVTFFCFLSSSALQHAEEVFVHAM